MALSAIRRLLYENTDPITQRCIQKTFRLDRHGTAVCFDAESLFLYIVQTGDLDDPLTRTAYARHELMRLQRIVGRALPELETLETLRREERERRQMLEFLVDEVTRVHASGSVAIEALENIRALASSSELTDTAAYLKERGVDVRLE